MASCTKQQQQPPKPPTSSSSHLQQGVVFQRLDSVEERLERARLEAEARGEIIDLADDDDDDDDEKGGEVIDLADDDDDDDGEETPKRLTQTSASACDNRESPTDGDGINNDEDSVTAAGSTISLDVGKAVEVLLNGEWLEASVKQKVKAGIVFQLHKGCTKKNKGSTVTFPTASLGTDVRRGNHGCFVCSIVRDEKSVLLCDGLRGDGSACNREAHYWCVGLAEVPSSDWFCRECDGHGAQYAASLAKSLAAAKEQVAAMAASAASAEQQRAQEVTEKKQQFPSHWTFCKAGDDIVGNDRHLIDVESCSDEWRLIEQKLRQSLPKATVVSAQRLESSLLFSEYTHRADVISAKQKRLGETKGPNEVLLWHGTKNPLSVVRHEHGLDPRFGKVGGFYGTGAYYASNARYCHGDLGTRQYVRSNDDGSFTILLSKVLLGSTVSFGQKIDQTLTMPPSRGGNGILYDSVSGGPHQPHQNGPGPNDSTIFAIYEASQTMLANIVSYRFEPPPCELPAAATIIQSAVTPSCTLPAKVAAKVSTPPTTAAAAAPISAFQPPATSVNKAAASAVLWSPTVEVFFDEEWWPARIEKTVPAGTRCAFEDGTVTVVPTTEVPTRIRHLAAKSIPAHNVAPATAAAPAVTVTKAPTAVLVAAISNAAMPPVSTAPGSLPINASSFVTAQQPPPLSKGNGGSFQQPPPAAAAAAATALAPSSAWGSFEEEILNRLDALLAAPLPLDKAAEVYLEGKDVIKIILALASDTKPTQSPFNRGMLVAHANPVISKLSCCLNLSFVSATAQGDLDVDVAGMGAGDINMLLLSLCVCTLKSLFRLPEFYREVKPPPLKDMLAITCSRLLDERLYSQSGPYTVAADQVLNALNKLLIQSAVRVPRSVSLSALLFLLAHPVTSSSAQLSPNVATKTTAIFIKLFNRVLAEEIRNVTRTPFDQVDLTTIMVALNDFFTMCLRPDEGAEARYMAAVGLLKMLVMHISIEQVLTIVNQALPGPQGRPLRATILRMHPSVAPPAPVTAAAIAPAAVTNAPKVPTAATVSISNAVPPKLPVSTAPAISPTNTSAASTAPVAVAAISLPPQLSTCVALSVGAAPNPGGISHHSGTWEFQLNYHGGVWVAYDSASADVIKSAAATGQRLVKGIQGPGKSYEIDLQRMKQRNLATNVERAIRCGQTGVGSFGAWSSSTVSAAVPVDSAVSLTAHTL